MSRCTAVYGHKTVSGASRCPVHGRRAPDAVVVDGKISASLRVLSPQTQEDIALSSTDPDTLRVIAQSAQRRDLEELLPRVASNPCTPEDVLVDILRSDGDNDNMRFRIAGNSSCPSDVLVELSADKNQYVRGAALGNPSTPPRVLAAAVANASADSFVERQVARNPALPEHTLRDLAARGDRYLDADLAENPSTPPDILHSLAGSHVQSVAINPSSPPEALDAILASESRLAPYLVAQHANLSPESMLTIATSEHQSPGEVLSRLADNPNLTMRACAAILTTDYGRNGYRVDTLRAKRDAYICEHFGVHPDNEAALEEFRLADWANIDADSDEAVLILALHRNK